MWKMQSRMPPYQMYRPRALPAVIREEETPAEDLLSALLEPDFFIPWDSWGRKVVGARFSILQCEIRMFTKQIVQVVADS